MFIKMFSTYLLLNYITIIDGFYGRGGDEVKKKPT